jgi:hypothetical protein
VIIINSNHNTVSNHLKALLCPLFLHLLTRLPSQISEFTAGALTGSLVTAGLFGGPGHI